jgi:hypothetical protein
MKESSQAQRLYQGFNNISVKKGDVFEIELFEGGRAETSYEIDVVKGKAELIGTKAEPCDELTLRTFTFRAEETGPVEVTAQATVRGGHKFSPNNYKLRVQ